MIVEPVPDDELEVAVASSMADMMVSCYSLSGLQTNDGKRVRRGRKLKFYGAVIDGESGLVSAQLEPALPIVHTTSQLGSTWAQQPKTAGSTIRTLDIHFSV